MTQHTSGATPPMAAVRRSGVRRHLLEAGLALRVEGSVELSAGGRRAPTVTLVDLSTCDRIGLKGRGSAHWLASRGLALPPRPNRLATCDDGLTVARYGEGEFLVADFRAATSAGVAGLRAEVAAARPAGCYAVPRSDGQAAFGLDGPRCIEALAGLCPADLRARAFGPEAVLQTFCAGVGAQVLNLSGDASTRIAVLCDASYAGHMWAALADAVGALDGALAGQAEWFDMQTEQRGG
jgi:sarcosine oxidase subunit gamma